MGDPTALPSESSGLIRSRTPGSGRPTQTPLPEPACSSSGSEMSVSGRASVIPYGVWSSAYGKTSLRRRKSATETGAPAESTSRMRLRAEDCPAVSSPAVATTFRRAAGDAKTRVASTAAAASANRAALRVPGFVTSICGTAAPIPKAGPYSANGANAATSRSLGVMLHRPRSSSS